MGNSHVRVRIERDGFKIRYEGDQEFYRSEIAPLARLVESLPAEVQGADTVAAEDENPISVEQISINQIVARMSPKTAADMVMCAATRLQMIDQMQAFSWDDLRPVIKDANDYKKSHTATPGNTLNSLIKSGRLNQRADKKYTIPTSEQKKIGSQIGLEPTIN